MLRLQQDALQSVRLASLVIADADACGQHITLQRNHAQTVLQPGGVLGGGFTGGVGQQHDKSLPSPAGGQIGTACLRMHDLSDSTEQRVGRVRAQPVGEPVELIQLDGHDRQRVTIASRLVQTALGLMHQLTAIQQAGQCIGHGQAGQCGIRLFQGRRSGMEIGS